MAKISITTREQACFYLGVSPYATEEEIKKAYREKVKWYHPDNGKQYANETLFCLIQQSYEFLLTASKEKEIRPIRVFQTNTNAKKQFQRQKEIERDREFLRQWEEKRKSEWKEKEKSSEINGLKQQNLSKEEEALNKIRAIWLAETIHRQIEREKEQAEIENKRKLYRAFMQQQMHDKEDLDSL